MDEKVSQLKCGDIVSLLVQCDKVCQVTRERGKVIVSPVSAQPTIDTTIATRILGALHEILSKCDGGKLHLNTLPQIYRKVTGRDGRSALILTSDCSLYVKTLFKLQRLLLLLIVFSSIQRNQDIIWIIFSWDSHP